MVLFALISPRLALFFILIFSDWIGRTIDGWIVPMLVSSSAVDPARPT